MRRIKLLLLYWLLLVYSLYAQAGDYYNSINPSASTFISDLQNRIRNPYTKISYDLFDETNIANYAALNNDNGTKSVFCVYSNYEYNYSGTFSWGVMSREHTFCFSWQPAGSESRPEYSDQHHLFPTHQNNANARRSNHPMGKVIHPSYTFMDSKLGNDVNGNIVYEPRDQHKGDAARALLYMVLRYHGIDGYDWTFNWLNNTKLPSLGEAPQDLATLITWHKQDPPDKWEIERNNYIQSIQQNRNPFIDHPEYVNYTNFYNLTKLSPVYAPEPQNYITNLSAVNNSTSITISWDDAASGNQAPSGYLIVAYNKDDYFLPIDGEVYSDDIDLSDGAGVVNIPYTASDTYSFSNVPNGNYYFTVFSYNGSSASINYKIDGSFPRISAALNASLAVEPTNHATNFVAGSIASSSIELNWIDASGTQLPEGYLIIGNTSNVFTSPIDGNVYNDDTNLSDGYARINVTYTAPNIINFHDLNPNTSYYFRIYSYNGSGGSRNYKTDETIPQVNATTLISAFLPNAWINEFHYDNAGTDVNEFIEVVIPNVYTTPTELAKFSVVLYNGNGGSAYDTKTLNTFTKGSIDTANGFTYYSYVYPTDGIQNGSPDGIALGYNSNLIQFLSYEGTFTAVGGIANGNTSTDIGIAETGTTAPGSSLGLIGSGKKYSDFTWTTFNSSATRGFLNGGQTYLPRTLNITAFIEGLYNGSMMLSDTITIELRSAASPNEILEIKKTLISTSGVANALFTKVVDNIQFYIVIKHRNSIETWSTTTKSFSFGSLNYDFTISSNQAFGNNLKQIGTKWCIYSGDINQDGNIDFDDLTLINDDASIFISNNMSTDLNSDGITDLSDLIICENNAAENIMKVIPQ